MKHLLFVLCFVVCVMGTANAKPILDIKTGTTSDGISYWLVQDKSLPLFSISFAFKNGTARETQDKMGSTRFLTTMLDEGAGAYDATTFQALLRDKSIQMSFNAGRDGFLGTLKTLTKQKDLAVNLLHLALREPKFANDSLERMRAANIADLQANMSDLEWVGQRLLTDAMYKNHPYAKNSMGTLETLANINADDLRATTARIFTRKNLVVGIAGNLNQAQAAKLIDGIFGDLPQGDDLTALPKLQVPQQGLPAFYELPVPQTSLNMAWRAIDRNDLDYFAQIVLNHIFGGGGFSARLMDNVRKTNGLTYGIATDIQSMDAGTFITLATTVKGADTGKTLRLINHTVQELKNKPIPIEELKAAQDYLTGQQVIAFASTNSIASTLTGMQFDGRDANWLQTWRQGVLAVKPDDILRVANKIFANKPVIGLAGAKPDIPYKTFKEIPNVSQPSQ